MSTSPEEQKDLDELKAAIQRRQLLAFDYMKELARMDTRELATCGHRNGPAEALLKTLQTALKDIERLHNNFLKKWPDR